MWDMCPNGEASGTVSDNKIAAPTGELNSPFLVTLSEGLFKIVGFGFLCCMQK